MLLLLPLVSTVVAVVVTRDLYAHWWTLLRFARFVNRSCLVSLKPDLVEMSSD